MSGHMKRWIGLGAVAGGMLYAIAGGVMAARNLRWFGWSPNANPLFVWLGAGLALIVLAFALAHGVDIWSYGCLGRLVAISGITAPMVLLLSRIIEFAILGTFSSFVAILAVAAIVHAGKLLPKFDIALLYIAAAASITWNTETPSAALLIVVGLIGAWVSYRALLAEHWRTPRPR